jgi:predicted nucleic acid-binding protein
MTGLDCNILVQLALRDHPANARTVSAVQSEVKNGSQIVFPPLIISEFLHVVTDPRRYSPPLTMTQALDWTQGFLENRSVGLVQSSAETLLQSLRWMRQFNLGRKRILDTELAAVFHVAGVRRLFTSNPADFEVFGVFEIVTP